LILFWAAGVSTLTFDPFMVDPFTEVCSSIVFHIAPGTAIRGELANV
jgi:hypothetical protein